MRHALISLLLLSTVLPVLAQDTNDRAAMQDELNAIADSLKLPRAFNLIHRLVGPSVVSIRTSERVNAVSRELGYHQAEVQMGEGSGFIIHSDDEASYILTNFHVVIRKNRYGEFVVDPATREALWYDAIHVATFDDRKHLATPVGADQQTDLALLRIEVPNLTAVQWADSDQVQVGSYVLALGYPLGVGYSATSGMVSALAKSTGIYNDFYGYESFIQTDAAINPGNSGGPLVDMHGRVIGVNANIVSRGGGNVGIGFAIPSNLARRVGEDLRDDGRISRPIVGIKMVGLDPEDTDALGIAVPHAVRITEVIPQSPADQGGLKANDIVTAVDGRPIVNTAQFRSHIAAVKIGDDLTFTVWRNGDSQDLLIRPVTREEFDGQMKALAEKGGLGPNSIALLQYGLILTKDELNGLVVEQVFADSPAAASRLEAGDRILKIADITQLSNLKPQEVEAIDQRPHLELVVVRDGKIVLARVARD